MSFLRRDTDAHARFRALLSRRLDERLPADESKALRRHLLGCARCRATDRDFRAQRVLLRGGRPALPPRDLWARTSAALDREVARGGRSGLSREPLELRGGSPRVAAASVVGLMLIVAVVGNQLSSGGGGGPEPGLVAVGPTPFTVPTQELAFVGQDKNGFAIYRTEVSQVCPAQSIDCTTVVSRNRQVVHLRGEQDLRPNSVAFHPQRDKVAIAAKVGRGESVYVVFLKPVTPRGIDQAASDTPRPPASALLTASLVPLTPAPATPAATTLGPGSSSSVAPGSIEPSSKPTRSPPPSGSGSTSPPMRTPRPTDGDASPSPSTAATPAPTATPSMAIPPTVAIVTASPDGDLPTDVQPILQDVLPAGAEPAWSPDGEILAFSAMPADGSHGPDIYIWHNGDQQAKRLTGDHRSYFASWAGNRIVASRGTRTTARDGRVLSTDLRVVNVVIDLRTGEQRRIDAPGLWLPLVDPTERFAIVWRGDLRQAGQALEPVKGALYLADWRRLDPFRAVVVDRPSRVGEDGGGRVPTPDDAEATDTPPVTATPSTDAASFVPATPAASAAASPRNRRGRRTTTPSTTEPSSQPTASPTPQATPAPTLKPTPTPAPTPDAASDAQPVEPSRQVDREPVLDWVGRWNTVGDTYGFWISETRGGSWGRLTIVSVDRSSGHISRDSTLLGPTLAKRMFSLGQDRVAWVAPVDDQPDGELRVRTWGPNGSGTVRIRDVDAGEGVPGF